MARWQLQEAKARFSEVVRSARKGPQEITVRGEPAAVVVSIKEYARLRRKRQTLGEFLRRSPLAGANLKIDRPRDIGRPPPDLS